MKTIYLHVGNFKTGSSAIQQACSDERKKLLEHGYDYLLGARPGNKRSPNHGKLPLSLRSANGEHLPKWYFNTDLFSSVASQVRTEIEASPCDNIVISSEEFYCLAGCRKATIDNAKIELGELFAPYHVKVLMYVRAPFEFAKSWYNQANKSRGISPIRRFADFFFFLKPYLLLPDINARFWRDCFGEDCLVVLPYRGDAQTHVADFFRAIGAHSLGDNWPGSTIVNTRQADDSQESNRLHKVQMLKDPQERELYLQSQVVNNEQQLAQLQGKVARVNKRFIHFCVQENIDHHDATFSLADILQHENQIHTHNHPLKTGLIKRWQLKSIEILRRLRKILQR